MALALRTGISPSAWAAEDEQAIVTALELLAEADEAESGESKGRIVASSG